jgi:hypothetical protein
MEEYYSIIIEISSVIYDISMMIALNVVNTQPDNTKAASHAEYV